MGVTVRWLLCLLFLLLAGCHARWNPLGGPPAYHFAPQGDGAPAQDPAPPDASSPAAPSSTPADQRAAPEPGKSATPQPTRMVHYNGYAKLRVDSARKAGDEAQAAAVAAGGYVEQQAGAALTLRVPVAGFQALFARLLALGEVLQKSVTAQDVTDAFTDVGLRLDTARAARDRLLVLLGKARTEQEKLDLLRELQRLALEIDALEAASRTLGQLAALSRISLVFVERSAALSRTVEEPVAAFAWIRPLSPYRRDVAFASERLDLPVPEKFVALTDKNPFLCESADGAVFSAFRRDNEPRGTARFWADAVKARQGPEFASVSEAAVGDFLVLRFVTRGDKPASYRVALRVDGSHLDVAEALFPTAAHEERLAGSVEAALQKGKP